MYVCVAFFPDLSRPKSGHPPAREGTNLGVFVPVWLALPQCEGALSGLFDLSHLDLLKRGCANSGVFGAC